MATGKLAGMGDTLEERVLSQVEYYFGDNNYARDKFLKTECSKNEGWLPIATLLTFNRLKTLLKEIPEPEHEAKIAEIVKASTLVDVDESGAKVRRNPEVPLDPDSEPRTIYLKGFSKTETQLDELLKFFKDFDGVEAVIMRWYKEKEFDNTAPEGENGSAEGKVVWVKKFKGSILVAFKTVDQAKAFMEKEDITYMGNKIDIKMWYNEYRKTKKDAYVARMEAKKKKFDGGKESKNGKGEKTEAEEGAGPKDDIVKGALLKLNNIPPTLSREMFKNAWNEATKDHEEDCKIAFIDFNKGATEGVVRLDKEGSAAVASKLLPDGKLKVEVEGTESTIETVVLDGDEEKQYLDNITAKRMEMKRSAPGGGRGRGRGRGGRGGKRRRY